MNLRHTEKKMQPWPAQDLIAATGVIQLRLIHLEQLANDLIWLRYEVLK